MSDLRDRLQGLWLPLVTPFRCGELDQRSLRRLVRHYAQGPVDGLILAATSGEGLTLSAEELERLVTAVRGELDQIRRYLPLAWHWLMQTKRGGSNRMQAATVSLKVEAY